MSDIHVICPYCGNKFHTPQPPKESSQPLEIECVPYTRDVGRFDPKGEEDWFHPDQWSRIGKDYLTWLNYERIGILRITTPKINVQYRVQRCPGCESLFDVYANYTEKTTLQELWPHLFGRAADHLNEVRAYYGESWPVWLVRRLGKVFNSKFTGAFFFGAILMCLGLLPYSTQGFPTIKTVLLYAVASITGMITLLATERYVHFIENTKGFNALLNVENPLFGIVHWRNYILCRLVGVQDGKKPRLTQVDIISGGISILFIFTIWVIENRSNLQGLIWFITSLLAAWLILFISKRSINNSRIRRMVVSALIILLGALLFLAFSKFYRLTLIGLTSLGGLVFWLAFAYFVGTAGFLSLSTSSYVLDGLTRIPMNLNPLNKFKNAKPLRVLQSFSTNILLILFISFLAMYFIISIDKQYVGLIPIESQFNWIIDWFKLILVFVFVASGFGLKRGDYFGIAVIYVALLFVPLPPINIGKISLDPRLIVVGFFFSAIIGYQIVKANRLISNLLVSAKTKELDFIDEKITRLTHQLGGSQVSVRDFDFDTGICKRPLLQDRVSTEDLATLLALRDRVEKVATHPIDFSQFPSFLAPLVTSVLLPVIVNLFSSGLWGLLTIK